MKIPLNISILLILIFLSIQCISQSTTQKKLNNEIQGLKDDISMKHASFGILVKNFSTNQIIYENNSEISLLPASVMKVATTAAALSILGKDFRFKTIISYSGRIDDKGTLNGNIYIIGGGDPTFGSKRFGEEYSIDSIYTKWYKAVIKAGIKSINGSVIADASIFDDEFIPGSWKWNDMGNYYGAGASGLNINENYYSVKFIPGKNEGESAQVKSFIPEIPFINFINRVLTGKAGTGDNVIIYGSPYSNERILEGTVPLDKNEFGVKGSIPDPPYFCAYSFHNFLTTSNIKISEVPTSIRTIKLQKPSYSNPNLNFISSHQSPTLENIIYQTNIRSINIYAEAILKMIGYTKSRKGSTLEGIKAVEDFWLLKNIDIEGFKMFDGSGLSTDDRVTAKQLEKMLEVCLKDNQIKDPFYNSLPIAGVSGSIKDNFKGTAAENNLRAKSGYMNSIRSYAGYVKNKNSDRIIFAIIINNYIDTPSSLKEKLEKIMVRIAELE